MSEGINWNQIHGNFPVLLSGATKAKISETLVRYCLEELDSLYEEFSFEDCEDCIFDLQQNIAECEQGCGSKKVKEYCEECKKDDTAIKNCDRCQQYGKYIHLNEWDERKTTYKHKHDYLTFTNDFRNGLVFLICKYIKEISNVFKERPAVSYDLETYFLDQAIEQDLDTVVPVIMFAKDCLEQGIDSKKDPHGLGTYLFEKMRTCLDVGLVSNELLLQLAQNYVCFIHWLSIRITNFMWLRRQTLTHELLEHFLRMLAKDVSKQANFYSMSFLDIMVQHLEATKG